MSPCVLLIFVVVPQIPLQPPLSSWNPCVLARSHNHELVNDELVRMPSAVCCLWCGPFSCCCCCCCLHAAAAFSATVADQCCAVYTMLCCPAGDLNLRSLAQSAHNKSCTFKLVLFQDKVAVEQESNAPSTTPCLLQSGALRAALADMTGALKPMRDQIMLDARHTRAYKCGRTLSSPT